MIHDHPGEALLTDERLLPSLLPERDGRSVVIRGSQVQRFFDSYGSALDWAYGQFGLERFFVKRIAPDQDVVHFTRDVLDQVRLVYDGPNRQFQIAF